MPLQRAVRRPLGTAAGRPSSPGLGRSWRLFQTFRSEQTQPDRFYRFLAADAVSQVERFTPLDGLLVLDVGGGPGYFADSFRGAGARYIPLEYDYQELSARSLIDPAALIGDGMQLPVRTASIDICYSSNVLEHVPRPWAMAEEMLRVLRPGGTAFLSFTNWLSPFGGHETSPWHYLGGDFAARRFERRCGTPPKNRFGHSLFAVSVKDALTWAAGRSDVEVLAAIPRYYPDWCHGLVNVPGLREIATWNLLLVMRRCHSADSSRP